MASVRQIAANRRNAQKSTGPKTAAGKARAAKNRRSHGFYSADIVLPGENPEEFEALLAELEAEFQPATPTERHLVHTIAACRWRLHRIVRLETGIFAQRMKEIARRNEILEEPADPPETPEETHQQATELLAASWIKDALGANALVKLSYHESRLDRKLSRALRELRTLQRERRDASTAEDSAPPTAPAPAPLPRKPPSAAKKTGDSNPISAPRALASALCGTLPAGPHQRLLHPGPSRQGCAFIANPGMPAHPHLRYLGGYAGG